MSEKDLKKLMEFFAILIVETVTDSDVSVQQQQAVIVQAANMIIKRIMSGNKNPVPSLN